MEVMQFIWHSFVLLFSVLCSPWDLTKAAIFSGKCGNYVHAYIKFVFFECVCKYMDFLSLLILCDDTNLKSMIPPTP